MPSLLHRVLPPALAGLCLVLAASASAGILDDVLAPTEGACARARAASEEELRAIAGTLDKPPAVNLAEAEREHKRLREEEAKYREANTRAFERWDIVAEQAWETTNQRAKRLPVWSRSQRLVRERKELEEGTGRSIGLNTIKERLFALDARGRSKFTSDAERAKWQAEVRELSNDLVRLEQSKAMLDREIGKAEAELEEINAQMEREHPEVKEALQDSRRSAADLEAAKGRTAKAAAALLEAQLAVSVGGASVEDVRGCIAERRKALADSEPSPRPPTDPQTPKKAAPQPQAQPQPQPQPSPAARGPSLALAGKWSGGCQGVSFGISGAFNITVANGVLSGNFSGGWGNGHLTGTVKADGTLSAGSGADGTLRVTWNGTVRQSDGAWSGTGNWTSNTGDRSCGGLWTS